MRLRILALLLPALLLAGCAAPSSAPPGESGYSFVDALGEERTVDSPQRVVAMMGGFAETWLLAGGQLAGVTDDAWDNRAITPSPDTPVVGSYHNPRTEELVALNPDLVLLSGETAAHMGLRSMLEGAGIPCAYFSVTYFEDYLQMLNICTDITGREDLYREHGLEVQRQIGEILQWDRPGEPPLVLLLITHSGGAAAQDSATMTGRILEELGCRNLADLYPSLLQEFSVEEVLRADPDFILVIPMGEDQSLAEKHLEELTLGSPAWSSLSAVEQGRCVSLPRELFLYKPNHRWAESYSLLYRLLYEEA